MMPLWLLLILFCVAIPIGTAIGVAHYAKVGFSGYTFSITVGLAVGLCCAWTMWIARKLILSRYSDPRYSLVQQERIWRSFYFAAILWIFFAGLLGAFFSSLLIRFVH